MPQKLMDVLMLGRCSHEFSWPRRAASGEYYQVCLLCATAYQYDWKTMRRGRPGRRTGLPRPPRFGAAPARNKPTWVPRARRLKVSLPVRYRGKNLSTWYEGSIQNISQSGLMFWGPQQLPANALIEMIFEMPEEISGQKNSNVLCQGRVVRAKDALPTADKARDEEGADDTFALAASVLDYKFLHSH